MSKLNPSPRVGLNDPILQRELREHALQVNLLSEGRISATYNAQTAAPTTGTHAHGDFVRNSAPVELGTTPNKYVIHGWLCVAGGTPGTWVQCRYLTGN
jgi:hypothetical protein